MLCFDVCGDSYAGYVRFGFGLLHLCVVYDGCLDFVFLLIVLRCVILGFHVLLAGFVIGLW